MVKAAVTGASGHIGSNLIRELISQGYSVRTLVRNDKRGITGLDTEEVAGDIWDHDALDALCDGADVVFHLAGRISVAGVHDPLLEKTNVDGVRNVVEASLKAGVKRLVHVSSIHAFSTYPNNEVMDETRELAEDERKHFPYDRSKVKGQKEVLKGIERGLDAVIVNPAAVLGPHDHKISEMGEVFLDIYHGKLPALIDAGYNWVDARDVADGIIRAYEKGRTGECYLLSGHWGHLAEFASMITKVSGKETSRTVLPMWLASSVSHVNHWIHRMIKKYTKFTPYAMKSVQMHRFVTHLKATHELGYNHRPFEETVRDTYHWFKEAGMLEPGWTKEKNFDRDTVPGR